MTVVEGLRCRPDIVFTAARLAVFVDGCFWHRCPVHFVLPTANRDWWEEKLDYNVARDRRNDESLTAAGWSLLRVWEHQTLDEMVDAVIDSLAAARHSAEKGQRYRVLPTTNSTTGARRI